MPDLEDRVAALEARADEIDAQGQHATNLAVIATREALTARDAHQKNVDLLNALRVTQAEHSRTLAEHGDRLDSIDGKLGVLTVGVHTIESLLWRLTDEGE